MERIGDAVRRELGRFGTTGAMADLVGVWPEAVGENLEGRRLQRIAGQHRRRLVIGLVHGGPAAAQVVVVHARQIVVNQAVGVDALQRAGRAQQPLLLQVEHPAGLDDARGGTVGQFAQLTLAPATVVLDIDEDPGPGPHLLREHQVDEVLQGGEALALAPDERPEGFLLVVVGNHVEPARLAGLDLDADIEPEVLHQLLEDRLAGRERLGRCLGRLQVRALGRERAAGGCDLGGLRR